MTAVVNPHAGGMLPVVWDFHHPGSGQTVRNVEALCRKVLNRLAPVWTPPLEASEYDDSLRHLLGAVYELTEVKWMGVDRDGVPRRLKYPVLGAYLDVALPGALVDYWRSYQGRRGERRVFDARKLEQAVRDAGVDDTDPGLHRPDVAVAGGAAGDPGAWAFPREWLEPDGDGGAARPPEGLGAGPGRVDPSSADRGGVGAGGGHGRGAARAPRVAPVVWVDCLSCGWRHYPAAPNGVPGWHYPDGCTSCGRALR